MLREMHLKYPVSSSGWKDNLGLSFEYPSILRHWITLKLTHTLTLVNQNKNIDPVYHSHKSPSRWLCSARILQQQRLSWASSTVHCTPGSWCWCSWYYSACAWKPGIGAGSWSSHPSGCTRLCCWFTSPLRSWPSGGMSCFGSAR